MPLGRMYDLVVQEFYPFTRTADLGVHLGYIDALQKSLCDGGVLLIGLSEGTNEPILSNITKLQDEPITENINLSFRRLPFDKVYQKLHHMR